MKMFDLNYIILWLTLNFLFVTIGLKNSNRKLVESCVRSLRTFYLSPQTPVDPIYEVRFHDCLQNYCESLTYTVDVLHAMFLLKIYLGSLKYSLLDTTSQSFTPWIWMCCKHPCQMLSGNINIYVSYWFTNLENWI